MAKVYRYEHKDGLGDIISSRSSLNIMASIRPSLITEAPKELLASRTKNDFLLAETLTFSDVYPVDAILVSTGKNLNDVYFTHEDLWAARNTGKDKPFNLNHNEFDIIGHLNCSFPIDDELNLINDDTILADLPEKFHLQSKGVIYRNWRDKDRKDKIDKIVGEIPEDKWAVSMECLYDEFDYAAKKPNGVFNIIARNDETSYLTKYLKVFGGTGQYDGHTVCIVPRKYIFSGQGLTDNPANPDSVIINSTASISPKTSVLISSIGDTLMESPELKELQTIKAEFEALKNSLANKEKEDLTAKVGKLENELATKETVIETLKTEVATYKTTVQTLESEKVDLNKTISDVKTEVATLQASKIEDTRLNTLLSAGFNKDKASELVAKFSKLDESTFNDLVETIKPLEASISTPVVEPKVEEVKTAVAAIENAEPEAAPINPTENTSKFTELKTSVASFLGSAEPVNRSKAKTKTKSK
jgi:uncharacterized coiled-coil protein SlyX